MGVSTIKFTALLLVLLAAVIFPLSPAKGQWTGGDASSPGFQLSPVLEYRAVSGDKNTFREDHWIRDGWAGGLEHFFLNRQTKGDWLLHLESRAVVPEEDYRFRLHLNKEDHGFFNIQYNEYRKYFDDTGGFFRSFSIPAFDLNKDMYLNIGSFSLEVGITLPDRPRLVLGYERRFKEGEKSLFEWGSISEGGFNRKIFPSCKEIDEKLDIFKLEVSHTIGRADLENRFQYERYKTDTTRFEKERHLDAGTSKTVNVSERYDHDAFFNTFHLSSHINEKTYLALGYLWNDLKGDAAFSMITAPFGPGPFDRNWLTRSIEIGQESHVLNLSTLVGPFRRLSFHGGIQAEFTETEGDTDAVLTETRFGGAVISPEALTSSRTDRKGLTETLGIRYSGIPYTSLYAEGKWTQQNIGLFERELEDGDLEMERFTDTDVDRRRYTIGFSSSPVRRLTLSGRYRWHSRKNDYDHRTDTEPGYSAFINSQELKTDEIEAKVSARVTNKVKASLQYQLLKTQIDTLSQTSPPESVKSGDYTANVYSVSVTAVPIPRLYLTGMFSYRDVDSDSFNNEAESILGYRGDVYTFIGTAGWAAGQETDFTLEYLFSWADNFEDNAAAGLPLGIDNRRHGLSIGCSRKLTDQMRVRFRYGYYKYVRENNSGTDDYEASLLGAGLELRF